MTLICPRCRDVAEGPPGERCSADGAVLLAPHLVPTDRERHPLLGEMIAGKYAVVDVLGAGGMGVVYEAVQTPLGRPVALKVLRSDRSEAESSHEAFFREAQRAARLSGPHIVTVFDYGEDARTGQRFIVLEKVEGPTLASVLAQGAPLEPDRATRIGVHILGALADAHAIGLVHGDVKPANILLATGADGGDHAMLLDFGVSRMAIDGDASGTTKTSTYGGTPAYMSPEHIRRERLTPAADQYALACVLFEMLAGRRPFSGETRWDVMSAHLSAPRPQLAADIPRALSSVVQRGMARDPSDRFPDVRAMMSALAPPNPGRRTSDERAASSESNARRTRFESVEQTITATSPARTGSIAGESPRVRRRSLPRIVARSSMLMASILVLVFPRSAAHAPGPSQETRASTVPGRSTLEKSTPTRSSVPSTVDTAPAVLRPSAPARLDVEHDEQNAPAIRQRRRDPPRLAPRTKERPPLITIPPSVD